MSFKIIGIILVILGCGGVGFAMAAGHRMQEASLRQLISSLDYMECELQYRLTPLPALCRQAANECDGKLRIVYRMLANELEKQLEPDVDRCMQHSLCTVRELPTLTKAALGLLGRSLGRYDLPGQLKGLEAVRSECRRSLTGLYENRENRLRSYQTLGLCAGAALAILLI